MDQPQNLPEEPPEYNSPRSTSSSSSSSSNNDDTEPLIHPDPPPPYKSQENINEDNQHEVSPTDINQITSAGKPILFKRLSVISMYNFVCAI